MSHGSNRHQQVHYTKLTIIIISAAHSHIQLVHNVMHQRAHSVWSYSYNALNKILHSTQTQHLMLTIPSPQEIKAREFLA